MALADNSENFKVETNSPVQNSTINPPQNRSGFRQFFGKTFKGRPNQQPTLLGHFLISSGLLALIGVGYFSLNWYGAKQAKEWLGPQEDFTLVGETLNATPTEKVRLAEQLNQIELRINRYSAMMVFFYKHYYISISLTSASALVAGICLFFISKKGWQDANNALINVFIITSGAVIFFGDLPGIFRHNDNSAASRDLYLEHISLRNQVRSYLATGATVGGDPEKPNEFSRPETSRFILYVDQKLAELNQIPIGFDPTGIKDIEEKSRLGIPEKTLPPTEQ
jgi:hypothetical protein